MLGFKTKLLTKNQTLKTNFWGTWGLVLNTFNLLQARVCTWIVLMLVTRRSVN